MQSFSNVKVILSLLKKRSVILSLLGKECHRMGQSQRSHSAALVMLVGCLPMYYLPNVALGTNKSQILSKHPLS